MCWSFEVSVAFAVAEMCLMPFALYAQRNRPGFYVYPMLLTIIGVEASEAVLWKYLEPGPTNKTMTTIIYYLISGQPLCLLWMTWQNCKHGKRRIATQWFGAFYGIVFLERIWNHVHAPEDAMVTTVGPMGHLLWRFFPPHTTCNIHRDYFFVGWLFPMFSIRPLQTLLPLGVPYMFLLSYLYLTYGYEFMSIWCWTGISGHIYCILEPLIVFPNVLTVVDAGHDNRATPSENDDNAVQDNNA